MGELASLFLKLGTIGFGGPAAHIALMREEVVGRRRWLGDQQFLDLVSATNLIPGPNSTELAIHIGHARAGWRGLVVAGVCFILPASLIVGASAWAYVRFGTVPEAERLLYGVKPVVIVIVVQALWSLARTSVKDAWLALLGIASAAATVSGAHELLVLAGAAAAGYGRQLVGAGSRSSSAGVVPLTFAGAAFGAAGTGLVARASLGTLFGVFFKSGALLFGSGYVLLAFLRVDLVERLHWLTEQQLLDAIAVGQVTPGPVFTTATFIGYLLAGPSGAVVATVAIFLPAFAFVAMTAPILPQLRRSPVAAAMLDGLNVASLALMAVVTWRLGISAVVDPLSAAIAAGAAVALIPFRVNSVWAIIGGAAVGLFAGGRI